MASSHATTVEEYLADLPEDRRDVVNTLRNVILRHLPSGYQETMNWGMICYEIPLSRYPDTYNGQPLMYIGLAAQKRHYALYLMGIYADSALEEKLRQAYAAAGKKIDLGKSCLRWRKLADVPLDALGEIIAAVSPADYIAHYEANRR